MKLTMIVSVAATGLLLMTGVAAAATNPQQQKMKACNAEATHKSLTGDSRKTFMKTCLAADAAPANSQQERMKTCNSDASAKGLKGADRSTFMKTCLSAK